MIATTEAMPMIIPSIVSRVRSLLDLIFLIALEIYSVNVSILVSVAGNVPVGHVLTFIMIN